MYCKLHLCLKPCRYVHLAFMSHLLQIAATYTETLLGVFTWKMYMMLHLENVYDVKVENNQINS